MLILIVCLFYVCLSKDIDIYTTPSDQGLKANYSFLHIGEPSPDGNGQGLVRGVVFQLHNPRSHFSIIQPDGGGCSADARSRSSQTAHDHQCHVATNAGFFNVDTGACIGNLVSQNTFVQGSDWLNPIFGLTESGKVAIGYLEQALSDENRFIETDSGPDLLVEVVSGVVWLVRDGKNNVANAIQREDPRAQATGNLKYFASVRSARTVLGVNKLGEIMILSVQGKTSIDGINLFELSDMLVELGFVSAINLDGGGSSTAVENDVLVDSPSDLCPDMINGHHLLYCEREVTSITCIHDAIQESNKPHSSLRIEESAAILDEEFDDIYIATPGVVSDDTSHSHTSSISYSNAILYSCFLILIAASLLVHAYLSRVRISSYIDSLTLVKQEETIQHPQHHVLHV